MRRAVRAVYYVFFGAGFAFASWASRIPQVRDGLRLSPASLGLLLLVDRGRLADRASARGDRRRAVGRGAHDHAHGRRVRGRPRDGGGRLPVGVAPVVVGLFLFGVGNGTWDVAMNVEGTFVEQRLGRAILPRFHAGFSIGTVAGALIGAAMVASASRSRCISCSPSRC